MNREWYFVSSTGNHCEVQFLDTHGRALAVTTFQRESRDVQIEGNKVPIPVLEVAERTQEIGGQYVDEFGRLLDFAGNPIDTGTP